MRLAAGTLGSLRLKDPGYGNWDEHSALPPEDVLAFKPACRAIMAVPTLRRLFLGFAVFGLLAVPLATFASYFLKEQWDLSAAERGVFFAYTSAASIVGLVAYGARGERAFANARGVGAHDSQHARNALRRQAGADAGAAGQSAG